MVDLPSAVALREARARARQRVLGLGKALQPGSRMRALASPDPGGRSVRLSCRITEVRPRNGLAPALHMDGEGSTGGSGAS